MHIGIDGYPLIFPKTGIGHYTFELATALARMAPQHTFELVAPGQYPKDVAAQLDSFPNLRAITIETNFLTRRWSAIGLPRYLRRSPVDLFHGTNYVVPLRNRDRNVLSVHDLSSFTYPETHDESSARRARLRLPIMLRSAARIITLTEAVKRELVDRFRIEAERVTAIPLAPRKLFRPVTENEAAEARLRLGINDHFILYVGTIEPRKNLLTLVRAFAELRQTTKHRPQLVIAGPKGWLTGEFDHAVGQADFGDQLRMIGYVSDDDLRALYSSCKVFVYPSLYEGFGLPTLEAMACGAPVIASRIDALVETLGPNARFVDPMDAAALAKTVVELLENKVERERLSASGAQHAARFSWEKTAALTLSVYEQLCR